VLVAFHKPWGVLSQFTPDGSSNQILSAFGLPARVHPIGRLDADSEGLLLLSDEPHWTSRLLEPTRAHPRRYWAQVEGIPTAEALAALERGVVIQGRRTRPCRAWLIEPQPEVSPREPPIRRRLRIPDRWIALELIEGRNRQVRKMTAAVGHPTLRLIRVRIGAFDLGDLAAGRWRVLTPSDERLVMSREQE
jgi:23S rRNA pseudouridine2457 synthase